jgi:two-component system, cell cycle sensor histidine kinase and response regulator CckA
MLTGNPTAPVILVIEGDDSHAGLAQRLSDDDLEEYRLEIVGEEAVRESEKRYRNLMENVPAIIYSFSTKHGGLFYSPQIEQVFGYPLKAFYDDPLLWKHSIHPDDVSTVENWIDKICVDGEKGFDLEYRVCNRSGAWIWLRDSSILHEVTNGDVVIHGIAQNVTRLKKAQEERLALEKQFQQARKLESLGVLAGGMAHDFNNILSIILGHCYLYNEDIDSGMDQKNHVKQIENSARRAADLCQQMLSYAGKNALVHTRINLWSLVDRNAKRLQSAVKNNVNIELDLKHDVPEITGDSTQIQQVVINLIINAAEAIGEKNGTIKIALKKMTVQEDQADTDFLGTTILAGTYACLTVSDNGCGMEVETQKRVFEPFYTTKLTGRGLGMSAVLGIVTSHDGAVRIASTPGAGTTVKVCFPLSAVPGSVETAPTAALVPSAKGRGTILLVADEEALRVIGSALLKAMGFAAMTASNGREAIEICRERGSGIDLILLDLLMPDTGGIKAYLGLREISSSIPIVICTGYAGEGISEVNDENAAVIQKPYKSDQLRNTLLKLLNKTEQTFQLSPNR